MDRALLFILVSLYACSSFACLVPGCSHASHDDYEHYVIVHQISKPDLDRLFLDNNVQMDNDQDRRVRNRLSAQQVRLRKAEEMQRQAELQQQLQSENYQLRLGCRLLQTALDESLEQIHRLRQEHLAQQAFIQHLMLGQDQLRRQLQILHAAAAAAVPPQDPPELCQLAELTQPALELEEENRQTQRENSDLWSSFFPRPASPFSLPDPLLEDCDLFAHGNSLSSDL